MATTFVSRAYVFASCAASFAWSAVVRIVTRFESGSTATWTELRTCAEESLPFSLWLTPRITAGVVTVLALAAAWAVGFR